MFISIGSTQPSHSRSYHKQHHFFAIPKDAEQRRLFDYARWFTVRHDGQSENEPQDPSQYAINIYCAGGQQTAKIID